MQSLIQIVILLILYLLAPIFVEEQDLERLAENRIIKYCYGECLEILVKIILSLVLNQVGLLKKIED